MSTSSAAFKHPQVSPLALFSLLLMLFLGAVEATILSTAMPRILEQLGGEHLYSWAFASFMIASTIATPFYGKFADVFGIRPCMLTAAGLFLLGSALCGSAQSMLQLVLFRAVQGAGAAGLMGLTMIAFGVLFSPEERGAKQSMVSMVWGVTSLLGPLLGGLIVTYSNWRWLFWLNLPLGIPPLIAFYLTFPKQPAQHKAFKFDRWGAVLLFSGLLILMVCLSLDHPVGWVGYPLSVVLLLIFVRHEKRVDEPLVPLHHFSKPVFRYSLLIAFNTAACMFTALTFVPLYLQGVLKYSPTETGFVLTPMMISWPICAAIAGFWVNRLGFRPIVVAGHILMIAGFICWAFPQAGAPLWVIGAYSALLGAGMGCSTSMVMIASQVCVPTREIGASSATLNLLRNIGSAIGINALGTLHVRLSAQMGVAQSLETVFLILLGLVTLGLLLAVRMPKQSPLEVSQQVAI